MKVTREYLKDLIVEVIEEADKEEIIDHPETDEEIKQLKSMIAQKKQEILDLEKQVRKLHASKRKPRGPARRDAQGNLLDKYGHLQMGAPGTKQRAAWDVESEEFLQGALRRLAAQMNSEKAEKAERKRDVRRRP